jgi:D-serine deaminase-like pyridoxal phosphate-dependent protein
MNMHTGLEATGGLLAATFAVAQVDGGTDIAGYIAKGGAVAVVGLLFYMFMRMSSKEKEALVKSHQEVAEKMSMAHKESLTFLTTEHRAIVERIEAAHLASAQKFEAGTDKIVTAVQSQVARCAETARAMERAAGH